MKADGRPLRGKDRICQDAASRGARPSGQQQLVTDQPRIN